MRRNDLPFLKRKSTHRDTRGAPDDRLPSPESNRLQVGDLVTWKKVVNDRSDTRGYRYDSHYGIVLSKSHETKGGNCILKILCGTQIHTRAQLRVQRVEDVDTLVKISSPGVT